jgi:uncharacterized metal-binding protein YceD (DUF177 family)
MTNDQDRRRASEPAGAAQHTAEAILDWGLTAGGIPASGRTFRWKATDGERAAFVARLDLLSCTALSAEIEVKPLVGGRFRARGTATAHISQACVVTLEPVENRLEESVDVEFRQPDDVPSLAADIDLQDEVEIEAMENDRLPLGKVVFDCLASAVDPYPRRPGAEFTETTPGAPAKADSGRKPEADSPFAALVGLKLDKPGR